ncbi:unnamed protein product [Prorocentrum cordatum]|uniref:Uncharacterized protein n=1 Tax=Prorocentrum cordatum TaxID=2364126 RepID=A0ABN9VR28_9DINO|nr:unnamed protein product [Polarella glacialis]
MAAGWRARAERGPAGYATRRTEHGRSAIGERRGGRRWAQHSAPRSRGQSRGRRRGPPWPPWRGVSAPEATRPRGSRDDDDDDDDDGDGDDDDDDDGAHLVGPQLRGLGADQMVGGSCALDGARSGGAVASDDALGDTAAPVSGLRKEKLRVAGEAPAAFTLLGFEGRRDLALRMASSLSWTSCSVSCARLPTSSLGWREPSSPMVRGTKGRHRH